MELLDFQPEREVIAKVLVGSRNYNTAIKSPPPDYDYKLLVLPTFNDLYSKKLYTTPNIITDKVDYGIHDLRKLPELLYKANINYLEIIFSNEIVYPKQGYDLSELVAMRDDIARMSLQMFYNSCIGTHYQKMELLLKGTESTAALVEKFGYDTKQASHAWRVLDTVERFAETGFTDFNYAIKYQDGQALDDILSIKKGEVPLDAFRSIVGEKLTRTKLLSNKYNVPVVEGTVVKMNRVVYDLIERYIINK